MKFELNEYHRNLTVEDLIIDVKRVAENKGGKYLSVAEYRKSGKYSKSSFRKYLGSWVKVLELAGLSTIRSNEDMQRISDEKLIEDIKSVCAKLSKDTLTFREYNRFGKYTSATLLTRFGSWKDALIKANLSPTKYVYPISDFELFDELEKVWIKLGRQPTTHDMKCGLSRYSLDTYARRFGGWRGALTSFVNYINKESTENTYMDFENQEVNDVVIDLSQPITETISITENFFKHRTSRNINLKLRFLVMQRDNFKCCACGASPAKDPLVELHVDHIMPWSKRGETEIDNLQTLCSKCNLGKSDLM